ncbi:PREDICTED: uncharacterized protein LOC102825500 [Chrysochloris asiatica]|uniref:SKA complex subunit 1 n=1 Tax=Chrysochloris asiatica TaxID=185453 RepID=A0A9B0TL70_CHRAS|nr:PREDICTED: uncharacterized protein LOC102825500 [Chrysochloris asiatica]
MAFSDLEQLCVYINEKIGNIKNTLFLRNGGQELALVTILNKIGDEIIEVNELLNKLELEIEYQEQTSNSLKELCESLEEDYKDGQHLKENIPTHLPQVAVTKNFEKGPDVNPEELVIVVEPASITKPQKGQRNIKDISFITSGEFNGIPAYLKARLTYCQINDVIKEINKASKDKIVHQPKKPMNSVVRDLYHRFTKEETKDTKGHYCFLMEVDIKEFRALKADKRFLVILYILEHGNRKTNLRPHEPLSQPQKRIGIDLNLKGQIVNLRNEEKEELYRTQRARTNPNSGLRGSLGALLSALSKAPPTLLDALDALTQVGTCAMCIHGECLTRCYGLCTQAELQRMQRYLGPVRSAGLRGRTRSPYLVKPELTAPRPSLRRPQYPLPPRLSHLGSDGVSTASQSTWATCRPEAGSPACCLPLPLPAHDGLRERTAAPRRLTQVEEESCRQGGERARWPRVPGLHARTQTVLTAVRWQNCPRTACPRGLQAANLEGLRAATALSGSHRFPTRVKEWR